MGTHGGDDGPSQSCELVGKLLHQCRREGIRKDIDVLSHRRPGCIELGIFLFLVLVDLEDVVRAMRFDQAPNGAFRQVGRIDFVEEDIDVIGIGRQAGQRRILLALTVCDGGLGVFFDRGIVAG